MRVPSCTQAYFRACTDPFLDVPDVCLPATLLPLPTRKFVTRTTVQWQTGSLNVGQLCILPQWTSSSANQSVYYSTGAFANSMATVINATAPGMGSVAVNSVMSNAPDPNVRVRLATWGVKTYPTTPGMTRGGTMFAYQSAQRSDLQVAGLGKSLQECFSDNAAVRVPFGTDNTTCTVIGNGPTLPVHLELVPSDDSSPSSTLPAAYAVVGCVSTESQSLTSDLIFYWEVVEVFNSSGLSPSHSETSFSGAVVAAVNSTISDNPAGADHKSKSFTSRLWAIAKAGFQAVAPVVRVLAPKIARTAMSFIPAVGPALSAAAGVAAPLALRALSRAIQSRQDSNSRSNNAGRGMYMPSRAIKGRGG